MTSYIADLEAAGYRMWSPAEVENIDGWTVRATAGFTRRLNSASAEGAPSTSEATRLRLAGWYAERSLPLVVRTTPLLEDRVVEAIREGWGLVPGDRTNVMTRDPTGAVRPAGVELVDPVDAAFLEDVCRLNGREMAHAVHYRSVMSRSGSDATGLRIGSKAVGLASVTGGSSGVFAVAVDPRHRRRGAATAIMQAAAWWAAARGARLQLLQVLEGNDGAGALYRSRGFDVAYRYGYLELPEGERSYIP